MAVWVCAMSALAVGWSVLISVGVVDQESRGANLWVRLERRSDPMIRPDHTPVS